jgi:hypothetical protein
MLSSSELERIFKRAAVGILKYYSSMFAGLTVENP